MPVDQWGNVIFADELTKSGLDQNKDERERKRQGEFANYLQDQGMAPGKGMPQSMGTEFNQFLKSGGLKGYQEEQIAQQQGESLAGLADAMAKDTDTEQATRNIAKAHAEAFRSGGIRGPAALEMMKELQARQMRDQMMKKVQGIQPGLVPESLHTASPFAWDIRETDKGPTVHSRRLSGPEIFNGHVNYATEGLTKAYAGIPISEPEHQLYEKSVGYLNTVHDSGVRTPDMTRVEVGAFPLSLRNIKPGAVQAVNPNRRFESGMTVPQTNDKGATGQTITKFDGGGATGAQDYKGSYQVFTPPPATPQPGQIGPRILAKIPVGESDKLAATEYAVNSMRNIADKIRSLKLTDAQRAEIYGKMTLNRMIPGTRAMESLSLTPELSNIETDMRHNQVRYESAMGNAKMAGSVMMYPIFEKLVGSLYDARGADKLDTLANNLQTYGLISQRDMSQRFEVPTLHFRPPGKQATKATGQATKPSTSPIAPQPVTPGTAGVSGTPMKPRPPLSSYQR